MHEPGGRWCTVPISVYMLSVSVMQAGVTCNRSQYGGTPVTVYINIYMVIGVGESGHTGGLRS